MFDSNSPFLTIADWAMEVMGGVFTTAVLWLWHLMFKPRIKISKKICRVVPKSEDQDVYYVIKVVNRSFWKLVDVRFSLMLLVPTGSPGGKSVTITEYACIPNQLIELNARPVNLFGYWTLGRNSEYAPHAFLVKIRHNIEDDWDNKSGHLEFRVYAKHGYSGRAIVKTEPYNDCDTVFKEGKFRHGNDTEIEPLKEQRKKKLTE